MSKIEIGKITPATIGAATIARANIPAVGAPPFTAALIIGKATGTVVKKMRDTIHPVTGEVIPGQSFTALTGNFSARVKKDKDNFSEDVYVSGILFFPGGSHERAVALLSPTTEPDGTIVPGLSELKFSFELGVIHSSAPAGYTWVMREIVETQVKDPLEDLWTASYAALDIAPPPKQAALPSPEKTAEEAPVEKPTKK